ncbi:MAG: DUF2062 domain-containing protein [Endozoicomonas sp.]
MSTANFLKNKILNPLKSLLQQGLTAEALAKSLAAGAVLAVFPVFGITSLLCVLVAAKLQLNQVAIQIANYCAYPLQFLLFIPFIRFGETLFGLDTVAINPDRIAGLIGQDFSQFLTLYGQAIAAACAAWLLVALPAMLTLSKGLLFVLGRVTQKN